MFGLGFGEIVVVFIIALIFLGPEKIPQTARTLGKFINELKRSMDDLKDAVEKDVVKNSKNLSLTPPQNPSQKSADNSQEDLKA